MSPSIRQSVGDSTSMLVYDRVARHLNTILPAFHLEQYDARIFETYRLMFEESLRPPPKGASPAFSRINSDGTPIQFSLPMGLGTVPLQFLGEAGSLGLPDAARREVSRRKISSLAELLRVEKQLNLVSGLIDVSAGVNSLELTPDHGGTFWVGASFSPEGSEALKIYINGKGGSEIERWDRLDRFCLHFSASPFWREMKELVRTKMCPLGMAIDLRPNVRPSGRVYFRGYGNYVSFYEDLLRDCGGNSRADAFSEYAEVMLGEDRKYPTQSAVFSLGIREDDRIDAKIEFSAHGLFRSDTQALNRCLQWLNLKNIEGNLYLQLLKLLSGEIDPHEVIVHSYLGLGWKGQQEYTTMYLQPDLRSKGSTHEL